LLPLLNDPDNQVRELTVQCLAVAGGPAAVQGLIKALNDRIETVGAAAVRGLARHAGPADVPALAAQMASNNNEYVREQIALWLGKTGDAANLKPLSTRKPVEKDAEARHAMSIAMARLGDAASKDELRGRLKADDPVVRIGALRDLPYVNDRRLLAEAAPLIADERPGLNVGPSHGPYLIRVCDVLVIVTAEMLGNVFSFEVSRRRYTPAELAAAAKVLAGLK
jgi:HEAT repeat protein